MIARTELAASYNGGHYLSVLQAQQQGLMGECKRIWRTADTERTCSYCAALDGTEVGMEEDFIFTHGRQTTSVTTPPAHPHCMCTISYEELTPPIQQNEQNAVFTSEDRNGIIYIDRFNSISDPMQEVTGSTFDSHPEETKKMIEELRSWG